jgi:hypothetical protein
MQRMGARSRRGAKVGLALALILGLSLCAAFGLSAAAQTAAIPVRPLAQAMATTNHDPFPLVTATSSGEVRFAVSEFADGLAHFYTFAADGLPVEFFVVWTSDNVIRTALNACDVCCRAKQGIGRTASPWSAVTAATASCRSDRCREWRLQRRSRRGSMPQNSSSPPPTSRQGSPTSVSRHAAPTPEAARDKSRRSAPRDTRDAAPGAASPIHQLALALKPYGTTL